MSPARHRPSPVLCWSGRTNETAMPRIRFDFAPLALEAELLDTPTAAAILRALPITAPVLTWGEEVYFEVPVTVGASTTPAPS